RGLAVNLSKEDRHAEAEPLMRQALDVVRRRLGEKHPLTAASYSNLAGNLKDQHKYAEADALFRTARGPHREHLGARHPRTGQVEANYAPNPYPHGPDARAPD